MPQNPDSMQAVVLTTGERGYVRKELAKLLGFHESHKGGRFARFLAEIAPNSLSLLEKTSGPILLPSGRQTQFFPAGIIADVASAVVNAAITGSLHRARQGIVGNCLTIMRSLATTGEVALIDEATGFQHHRAPDALQELISKLLRQSSSSWERRFHPDYYRALYRLFNWRYQGHEQNPPHVIGQITLRWVRRYWCDLTDWCGQVGIAGAANWQGSKTDECVARNGARHDHSRRCSRRIH